MCQVEKAAAGVAAGFVSTLLTFPLETMRTCLSLSGSQGGLPALCRSIWAQGGARAFYRVRVCTSCAVWHAKAALRKQPIRAPSTAIACCKGKAGVHVRPSLSLPWRCGCCWRLGSLLACQKPWQHPQQGTSLCI